MIPLSIFLLGVRRRLSRRDRSGVQRADAAVAAARGRAHQSPRRPRHLPRRSAAAVHPAAAAARAGDRRGHRAAGARPSASALHTLRHRCRCRSLAFVVVCELLLPLLIVGRDPERVLEVLLPTFAPIARALGPMTRWIARTVPSTRRGAAADARRSGRGGQRGREGLHRHRRAGRAHQERGAPPAPEHRRLRRHAGARGDDAAPRHRRHPRHRDGRRRARAVPRAGVLALSGLQGLARQHRRLHLRQGPRRR